MMMKVQIEAVAPARKSLAVEIPQEVIVREFDRLYAELRNKAILPGFRKGKAPIQLLEKKYGNEVEENVVRNLVPDYYQKAVEEIGITPVGYPHFEQIEVKRNGPLSFKATVDVRPPMPPLQYKGISIPRRKVSLSDEAVERALLELQDAQGQLEAYPDDQGAEPVAVAPLAGAAPLGGAAPADYVVADYVTSIDGSPLDQGNGTLWQVGVKAVLPELDQALLGRKKGDRLEIDIPFPKEHPNPKIAGKTLHFEIEIKAIKKKVLPALDDEFAKDMGQPSLVMLREKVRESLFAFSTSQEEHRQKKELTQKLIALHPLDLPASMVESELHRLIERDQKHPPQGEDCGPLHEQLHAQYEPMAKERVHGTLVLQAIATEESVQVSPEELDHEIEHISKATKRSVQEIRQALRQEKHGEDDLKFRMRLEKTLNRVYALAQFEDQGETIEC